MIGNDKCSVQRMPADTDLREGPKDLFAETLRKIKGPPQPWRWDFAHYHGHYIAADGKKS
jgi:hypothetical protein